jgi:hypothetical protein
VGRHAADIVAGTRCGSAVVEGLNEALLGKAAEVKLLRCPRIRGRHYCGAVERRIPD